MIERDLSRSERSAVRDLILKSPGCANCDQQTGECLPLEVKCPMLQLQFNGATLCEYFRIAVLPENPELEAVFSGESYDLKTCPICQRKFRPATHGQKYCSSKCKLAAQREASRNRKRKQRLNVTLSE